MLVKFGIFLTICVVALTCYYDWKVGTLPALAIQEPTQTHIEGNETTDKINMKSTDIEDSIQSIEVQVINGDTVLSVIERINEGSVPVSISQIILDFEKLNPNVEAHVIVSGNKYLFPLYNVDAE